MEPLAKIITLIIVVDVPMDTLEVIVKNMLTGAVPILAKIKLLVGKLKISTNVYVDLVGLAKYVMLKWLVAKMLQQEKVSS